MYAFTRLTVLSAAIALPLVLVAGCSKPPVAKVPTGYVSFTPSDNAFSCDAPNNWDNSQFSELGTDSGGNFISGPAKINITSSMIGSVLGDLAASNNSQAQNLADQLGTQAPVTKSPLEQAHEQFEAAMEHEHADYIEIGEQSVESKAGEGEMSEFTCDAGKTHGYRATYLGKDRSIEIVCSCPTTVWTELQPSFQHIVESITPGSEAN
jgi:hypothetical protein